MDEPEIFCLELFFKKTMPNKNTEIFLNNTGRNITKNITNENVHFKKKFCGQTPNAIRTVYNSLTGEQQISRIVLSYPVSRASKLVLAERELYPNTPQRDEFERLLIDSENLFIGSSDASEYLKLMKLMKSIKNKGGKRSMRKRFKRSRSTRRNYKGERG